MEQPHLVEESRSTRTSYVTIMNALDFIASILETNLSSADLRYCFITESKRPIKVDGQSARPNHKEDFVELESLLQCESIDSYAGIGISVQASNICAIDVDKCFSVPFDITSADDRAKDMLSKFKNEAYCEFSFSGKGLRILFKHPIIENYSDMYYIKNESVGIEYYQPAKSYRYVTVTGKAIQDLPITELPTRILTDFLEDYMLKPQRQSFYSVETEEVETRSFKELSVLLKRLYFKDIHLQNLWFGQAPGSGKNESELDYQLIAYLYERITQDKQMLKQLFETSPYFKSKDAKHVRKWQYNDFRYFNYIYNCIRRSKQ